MSGEKIQRLVQNIQMMKSEKRLEIANSGSLSIRQEIQNSPRTTFENFPIRSRCEMKYFMAMKSIDFHESG